MKNIYAKKYIPLLITFIVILVFGVYQLTKENKTNVAIFTDVGTYDIQLTSNGFEPRYLTAPLGSTISFTSQFDTYFWPASNLHPSHATYPEFDSQEPIAPDDEWSFVFEEPGVWEYHDHLAPYFSGEITILDETKSILKENPCENEEKNTECWHSLLFSELNTNGIDSTFDLVKELYIDDKKFRDACHGIAHDIGLEAYTYFVKDKDSVLTAKSSACAYGFYHGFMEALLTTTRDIQEAREFCLYIDKKITPYAPGAALQCFHGIGHGVVDMELGRGLGQDEDALTNSSLLLCEEASYTNEELYRCTSGVYNNIANIYIDGKYINSNSSDVLRLCSKQPDAYKESCYGNMNALFFWDAGKDFKKAVLLLENVEEEYKESSMRYLSGLSVINTLLQDIDYNESILVCRSFNNNMYKACIEGLADGLLEHGEPGYEYKKAIDFCESDNLNQDEKSICFSYAFSNLEGWYEKSKAQRICDEVGEEYRSYCKNP